MHCWGSIQAPAWASCIGALCVCAGPSRAFDPPISTTVLDVATDYTWGYRCGLKQPLGHYSLGRTVHNISRKTDWQGYGSPDYLIWVDEHTGEATILQRPVGVPPTPVINPGGMATFDESGSIWFVLGGRANDLPFDLARSESPYDPTGFETLLDDFVSDQGSTVPCFHAVDGLGLLTYRHGGSSWAGQVRTRFGRYDLTQGTPALSFELDVAKGSMDPDAGKIGIEQLWTRYDPRRRALALTWQWWNVDERRFGSNPFVYTDDAGATWRLADGSVVQTPIEYGDRTPAMVPFDHIGLGLDSEWQPRDIGWGPQGTPWIILPDGGHNAVLWRWTGAEWSGQTLAGPVIAQAKPYALGATRDFLVFAYSEDARPRALFVRSSRDDGATWSEPTLIAEVPQGERVGWVSFVQPDRYLDNAARFIFGYSARGDWAKSFEQSISWTRVQVGPRADFNADAAVDTADVLAFLNAWASGSWTADFNDDGTTNTIDVLAFLGAFAGER